MIAPHLAEHAAYLIANDPAFASLGDDANGYTEFRPRPDRPELFDQQSSFVLNKDPVAFFLKGNAAGGTTAAAHKTAKFLLETPPPRHNTPFWVISDTYEQVCGTCWAEKLVGEGHLPRSEIDWDGIRWIDARAGHPRSVPLLPWPDRPGKNWTIEFKSYEQGRRSLQARSIGGFWFSEQFPLELFLEVLRACRNYMYPGGQYCEFTPIDPLLCMWVEKLQENPPKGWKFYRGNTECNRGNLAGDWYEQFFGVVPDEMRATRQTGALASFSGQIYPSWEEAVHVVEDSAILFPPGVTHHRAGDWGASEEHPFATTWGYKDGIGDWWIYDEYWCSDQDKTAMDHAVEILARSIAWGWPWPEVFSTPQQLDPKHHDHDPVLVVIADRVANRVDELAPSGAQRRVDCMFGQTWFDPSRPGEIVTFGRYGIPVTPASNDVYAGIDLVRSHLKIVQATGQPRLHVAKRCVHLREEMRKYRWKMAKKALEKTLIPTAVAKPEPLKREDDTVDSLRYLITSESRQAGAVPTSMSHSEYQRRKSVQLRTTGRGWRGKTDH